MQLLLQRFARVFEQTYTRFLDLKQAEAQAREAQIEAALERVRSRAMAMHESNELEQVVAIMFEQLSNLGFEMNLTNVSIIDKNTGDCVMWATAKRPDGTTVCRSNKIPYIDHPCYARGFEAWIAGEEFLAQFFSREEKDTFLRYFFDLPHLIPIDEAQKKYVLESPGWARSSAFTKHGVLEVQNYQAIPYSEEENDILKRFARVFEQTYTRFLDLKKAEAQAREAQIETALERVRSRTMAMHESDELAEAASVLFQQLQGLGVLALRRCFILIIDEVASTIQLWYTSEQGESNATSFTVPAEGHFVNKRIIKG